jgi:hypothetical protein
MTTKTYLDQVVSEIYEALRVNDSNKVLELIDLANQLKAELETVE